MKVTKEQSDFGTNIFLEEGDKYLGFTYGGNEDLYWSIHNKKGNYDNNPQDSFIITKENYGAYHLFEKLYSDIENIHIFEYAEDEILESLDDDEKDEYLMQKAKEEEEEKPKYRDHNYANYNELFNPEAKTITWYSDETSNKVANILKIRKEKDTFVIEFTIQPPKEGYREDFHSAFYIPIRISNSGSRYNLFNIVFMRMYEKLKKVDDVKDIGHQIDIEEYLFAEEHKLVKKI